MVGRPRSATFVAIETLPNARRKAAAALRGLGFARLLASVFWAFGAPHGTQTHRRISVALRRALDGQPFAVAVFTGHAPVEKQVRWIVSSEVES